MPAARLAAGWPETSIQPEHVRADKPGNGKRVRALAGMAGGTKQRRLVAALRKLNSQNRIRNSEKNGVSNRPSAG